MRLIVSSEQGFSPDHRDIHLLKLRNYTIGRQIPDEELHSDDAQEKIMEVIRAMVPFVSVLNLPFFWIYFVPYTTFHGGRGLSQLADGYI